MGSSGVELIAVLGGGADEVAKKRTFNSRATFLPGPSKLMLIAICPRLIS